MLILSRKAAQQIQIGPDIVITVVAISGGQVRIGIEAPRDVRIHREEVQRLVDDAAAADMSLSETASGAEPATTTPVPPKRPRRKSRPKRP